MPLQGGAMRHIGTGSTVRGFNVTGAAPLYLNGARFPINSLSGAVEPYAYERVEVLKGPASILYGQAAPGGVFNLVSKRPTDAPLREVELELGSWNKKQIAADVSDQLTEDGRMRYRLTALARDADGMIDEMRNDRLSLPGLSLGAGVRHVGWQEIDRMRMPTYTLLDAAVRYQYQQWQLALNVKNLANKTYLSACTGVCLYGDARNVTLTARVNW